MSNSTIQCKPDLSMPKTYPAADRNFWKGVRSLKYWTGWEKAVVWPPLLRVLRFLCIASRVQQWLVSRVFGFWVSQQACDPEDLWCAWRQAGISQLAKLLVLTPEPMYSGWKRNSSLLLSCPTYGNFWRMGFFSLSTSWGSYGNQKRGFCCLFVW